LLKYWKGLPNNGLAAWLMHVKWLSFKPSGSDVQTQIEGVANSDLPQRSKTASESSLAAFAKWEISNPLLGHPDLTLQSPTRFERELKKSPGGISGAR